MVKISRDGKRVYWTNSLYSTWDDQFYPDGVPAAMIKADVGEGTFALDPIFLSNSRTVIATTRPALRPEIVRPTAFVIRPPDPWGTC